MKGSWITLYPQWYAQERESLGRHYPGFKIHEPALENGRLLFYGVLQVRPPGGTVEHPVLLEYPASTPFEKPLIVPLKSLPELDDNGDFRSKLEAVFFDHRHQMPNGMLCLFQRETRSALGGDVITGIQALGRAERWFLGIHTGNWPPDSAESELEAHFERVSDILLSEVFFREDIDGYGRFYMVPDLRRLQDSEQKGLCPMIVTTLTEESLLIKMFDARDDLSRIYPWIKAEQWDLSKIAELEAKRDEEHAVENGYWWSLPSEPRPFRDGRGLLDALAPLAPDGDAWPIVNRMLGGEMSTANRHFFGLRYPTRHDGVAWLMLVMARGKREVVGTIPDEKTKRETFKNSLIFGLRVHSARPSDLNLRNTGVVAQSIKEKRIAMIGLGALGSEAAELLAKAGVQSFRLYDMDRLSTGNVARHVGGLNEFGAPKVRIVATRINEINPYVRFQDGDIIFGSAVASLEELADFIRPADLVISTVADESVESFINQVAVLERKPVIYGRALRRGGMGRVFLVRPGRDACKACLALYARRGREGDPTADDWIDVPESEADALVHECGRPIIPASAVDLAFVAGLVARVALNYLEESDDEANHWIWTKLPAPEVDARLSQPFGTFTGHLEPDLACYACQEPDVRGIKLLGSAQQDIVNFTEASPNVETGGVLIGYVDSERWVHVIRATGPGPNAERSKYRFSRDVAFVQAELERAARELGEQGIYVGEWHSHLVAELQPSTTDIDSLLGIASASDYLTRCPVMVIAGLAPASKKVESIRAWSFPIGGRVYDCVIELSS